MMTNEARRTALYVGGGALLVAWLAAANSSPRQEPAMVPDAPAASSSAGSVAGDLRQEAARLRARLGEAPTPSPHARNPFQFEARPSRASRGPVSGPAAMPETVPVPPAPPALTLMGIAATTTAAGPERTAILGGPADAVYMVTVGQRIADRYEVTAIGADAVELKDLTTGGYRRLALR